MEATRNSPALILQRRPYRESDILVTAYTLDFGKLTLVARGAKKLQSKLAGHLEPLTRADLMIVAGRGFDYVGGALTADAYPSIRADLNKLYYAGRALGLFDRLVGEGEADRELFFLLIEWLERLGAQADCGRERGELYLAAFSLQLLGATGYRPRLDNCLDCGRPLQPGRNYFSLLYGGLVGGDCFDQRKETATGSDDLLKISDNCVKVLRLITQRNPEDLDKLKLDKKLSAELSHITESFIKFRL